MFQKNLQRLILTCSLILLVLQLSAQQKLGDNLGNHTATSSLNLNGYQVLNTSGVAIGTVTLTNGSVALEVSGNKAIKVSSVTNTSDISSPLNGMIIFTTIDNKFHVYQNGGWVTLLTSANGFVDLTSDQSIKGVKTFASDTGFLATGSGSGTIIPVEGAGSRMMWYSGKSAFRAGNVSGTQWNNANVGANSMALGQSTTASGANSTAFGLNTTASGANSTAFGNLVSTANFTGSLIIGDYNNGAATPVLSSTAANQFTSRFAGGYRLFADAATSKGLTIAGSTGDIIISSTTTGTTAATGALVVNGGLGVASTSRLGGLATYDTDYSPSSYAAITDAKTLVPKGYVDAASIVANDNTTPTTLYPVFATGVGQKPGFVNTQKLTYTPSSGLLGATRLSIGSSSNTASGSNSAAMGINVTASGSNTMAFGSNAIANGNNSIAIGSYLNATQGGSFVIGDGNNTVLSSSTLHQFSSRFTGGYRLYADAGLSKGLTIAGTSGDVLITSTTTSTSAATGALVVSGGLGVGSTSRLGGLATYDTDYSASNYSAITDAKTLVPKGYVDAAAIVANDNTTPTTIYPVFATGVGQKPGFVNTQNLTYVPLTGTLAAKRLTIGSTSNTASGSNSVAMGINVTASGSNTMAFGNNTIANGNSSVAIGSYVTAAHSGSFVIGDANNTVLSSSTVNQFSSRFTNGYHLYSDAGLSKGLTIAATSGDVLITSTTTSTSATTGALVVSGGLGVGSTSRLGGLATYDTDYSPSSYAAITDAKTLVPKGYVDAAAVVVSNQSTSTTDLYPVFATAIGAKPALIDNTQLKYVPLTGTLKTSRAVIGSGTASGTNAAAFGTLTVASGSNSAAFGNVATASGNNTIAMGNNVTAADAGSFVIGDASALPLSSSAVNQLSSRFAGGYRFFADASATKGLTMAPTTGDVVISSTTTGTTAASGALVISGGLGVGSTSRLGGLATYDTDYSASNYAAITDAKTLVPKGYVDAISGVVVSNQSTSASEFYPAFATAIGTSPNLIDNTQLKYMPSLGRLTVSRLSVGITTATGTNAAAFGTGTTASGTNSAAFGTNTTAIGTSSMAFGNASTASGTNAIAFGNNANTSANNTVAIGSNLTAASSGSFVIGDASTTALSSTTTNQFSSRFANGYRFYANAAGTAGLTIAAGGNVNMTGTATIGSNVSIGGNAAITGTVSVTGTATFNGDVNGNTSGTGTAISGFSASLSAKTASYTLTAADNGKVITVSNASGRTITIPSLPAGFNCMVVQLGTGLVTFTGTGTATVVNRSGYNQTAGQYAIVSIVALPNDVIITSGDMQ